jgi:hypothetical protein
MIIIAEEMPTHEDTGRRPDLPPQKTGDDLDITGWDVFIKSGELTPLYAPIVRHQGREVHASNRVFCKFCRTWVTYSGSVTHYKQHADLHNRTTTGPDRVDDVTVSIYSFVLARGEPLTFVRSRWFV